MTQQGIFQNKVLLTVILISYIYAPPFETSVLEPLVAWMQLGMIMVWAVHGSAATCVTCGVISDAGILPKVSPAFNNWRPGIEPNLLSRSGIV